MAEISKIADYRRGVLSSCIDARANPPTERQVVEAQIFFSLSLSLLCLSILLSIYLIHLSIYVVIYLSIYAYVSQYLFIYLFIYHT